MTRRQYLLISLAFATAALGMMFYQYSKGHKSIENVKPDFTYAAPEFLDIYNEDEDKANEMFLGKIIQVTGIVNEIKEEAGVGSIIILDSGSLMESIQCEMSQQIAAGSVAKDQSITIKGYCTGKILDIVLNRCVIVE
jgi:hypothetical protein